MIESNMVESKKCGKCGSSKPLSEFFFAGITKPGTYMDNCNSCSFKIRVLEDMERECEFCHKKYWLWGKDRTYCKDCSDKKGLYHNRSSIKIPKPIDEVCPDRLCKGCGIIKPASEFYSINKKHPKKLMPFCKQCHIKRSIEYQKNKNITHSKKWLRERVATLEVENDTLKAQIKFLLEDSNEL